MFYQNNFYDLAPLSGRMCQKRFMGNQVKILFRNYQLLVRKQTKQSIGFNYSKNLTL